MKRRIIPIFLSAVLICLIIGSSYVNAQDFDSISHPPDISVKESEYATIEWTVTISSVTDPTYDVYTDGDLYIEDFPWTLDGGTGIIMINVNTSVAPGDYTYIIFVSDGDSHEISDSVKVTIVGKSGFAKWFESNWVYIIFVVLMIAMVTGMVFVRRKGFKKGESIISG